MPSTVEQLSPTRAKLTIEVPFADLEPAIEQAYKDIANQVNIPGFRKGKVPARLIDQRFGRGLVLQEAINAALPRFYGAALEESKVYPLGQPEIDITELTDGEKVIFTAEVDVRPEFEVPSGAEISVSVPKLEVSDEQINERIELLRERFAETTVVDRAAADGDVVSINLVGRKDGEILEDAEAEGVTYKIGSGTMLDGMDEAIIGLKAGDSKVFTSTLVGGSHRGEEAEIEVSVLKVSEQKLPELDDDFAQLVSSFDTVEQMREDLAENLLRSFRIHQVNLAREKVLEAVIAATEFELPTALLENEQAARKANIEDQLRKAGLTLADYLADAEDEEAETEEEFWAAINKRVEESLRSQIILDKLGEEGNFEVTQEDMTQMIFAKAQQAGTSPEEELKHMMEHDHAGEWMAEIRRGKALGKLVSEANVVDEDGNVVRPELVRPDGSVAEEAEMPKLEGELVEQPAKKKSAGRKGAKVKAETEDEKPKKTTKKADEAEK